MPLNRLIQTIPAEKAEIAATISLIAILVIAVVGGLAIGLTWHMTGIIPNPAKITVFIMGLFVAIACNEALLVRESYVAHRARVTKMSPKDIPNCSGFQSGTAS